MTKEYWFCMIGPFERDNVPFGGSGPPRMAVRNAIANMMGADAENAATCTSGWGCSAEKAQEVMSVWSGSSKAVRIKTKPPYANPKTAEERGMNMMYIPLGEIPSIAMKFYKHLESTMGMCGEVYLTAWTVYAQCVEGLECTDDLYKARPQDIEWFKMNKGDN